MKCTSTVSLLIIILSSLEAQDLRFAIKNEMKKELMIKVNPSFSKSETSFNVAPGYIYNKKKEETSLLEFYKKYRSGTGGEEFDNPYEIHPHSITYSSKIPINQIEAGKVVPIYNGGHFTLVNPSTNGLGLINPTGLDLSGTKKKKMSEKTKQLLELLFNVKLCED